MTIKVTYNVTDVYMSQSVSPVYITVSYSDGGASGGGVWGSITGTLSNQTDLQTALDGKFDDPTGTTLQYIDGTGALQTFPLTLPVLQEVRNQTGATLAAGTVVYINGATGNKPTVTKAIATGDATSAQTLGMISAAIANNGVGYVVVIGTCGGLDTSAYTEGQQLYLSGTVAGGVTTTKPYAPIHLVYVGIVTRAHPNLGTIEVRVQNGIEVDEIHNVSAQTPSNNDGLFYNTSTSLWESKAITTALGYTPVPTTRNITINGVTYDLSADRTWTISAGISGSGAAGQVTYWTGASAVSGSNNLFWDATNNRLGINATPGTGNSLHVSGNTFTNTLSTNGGINLNRNGDESYIQFERSGTPTAQLRALNGGGFRITAAAAATEWARFDSSGNFGIGITPTVRLQVSGDTLLRGSGATSATTALTVQNSSSTNLFRVLNDGTSIVGNGTTATIQPNSSSVSTTQTLFLQASATDNCTQLDIRPSGTNNTLTGFYLRDSSTGATGSNLMIFGRGNASLPSTGVSYIGNIVAGNANADSLHLGFLVSSVASARFEAIRLFSSGNVTIQTGGTYTDISSSILSVNSTTKGFLPPRMTTTQKNAIATPSAGLVVYDTTLNKLCVYTTAWETITSI